MRWTRYLQSALVLSLGLLILSLFWFAQKPLCINSKIVERIDRVSDVGTETVWRCGVSKAVPYSEWFSQVLPKLDAQAEVMERTLESMDSTLKGRFDKKMQITIMTDEPLLYRLQGNQLFIGEELLLRKQVLARSIVKFWLRPKVADIFVLSPLLEESIVDFVMALSQGESEFDDIALVDPKTNLTWTADHLAWPSILKSQSAYCANGWIRLEDIQACAQGQFEGSQELTDLSFRPLLLKYWMDSYHQLTWRQKFQFSRSLSTFFSALGKKSAPENLATASGAVLVLESSQRLYSELQKFVIQKSFADEQKQFALNLLGKLVHLGHQDTGFAAKFDFLYVVPGELSADRDLVKSIQKLAKAHPDKQLAIRDDKNIWLMPSKSGVSIDIFSHVYSDNVVAEYCGDFSMDQVLQFENAANRLLYVVHCAEDKEWDLSQVLTKGPRGFAAKNPTASFVSFHVPSIVMKKAELGHYQRLITELRMEVKTKKDMARVLGWQDVQWIKEEKAYAPRANIEGVQLFR